MLKCMLNNIIYVQIYGEERRGIWVETKLFWNQFNQSVKSYNFRAKQTRFRITNSIKKYIKKASNFVSRDLLTGLRCAGLWDYLTFMYLSVCVLHIYCMYRKLILMFVNECLKMIVYYPFYFYCESCLPMNLVEVL